MAALLALAFLVFTGQKGVLGQQCNSIAVHQTWVGGWNATFFSNSDDASPNAANVDLVFSHPVDDLLLVPSGTVTRVNDRHYTITLEERFSEPYLSFEFDALFPGPEIPAVVSAVLADHGETCGEYGIPTLPPSTEDNPCSPTGMEPYDYSQVLCLSLVFLEIQRAGPLPADNRVQWRQDSCLYDGEDIGYDLTGGYFDAGDHVKFGLPQATFATLLAWGMIEYRDGYEKAGQLEYGLDAIKWASDYLLKTHIGYFEVVGQVGQALVDHGYWGRPEDMTPETVPRPSFILDAEHPGSDLVGETAAALAAAYIVFKDIDLEYAEQCLDSAKGLYKFADEKRGLYTDSITDAVGFYTSDSYGDELTWAALWLYYATGDVNYLNAAKNHWEEFNIGEEWYFTLSWQKKHAGIYVLMAQLDGGQEYVDILQKACDAVINDHPYLPGGLVYLGMWGTVRTANDATFILLRAAALGIKTEEYLAFARTQVDYTLGSSGQSYVIGYGPNYPTRPHHRSSSCPPLPEECSGTWAYNQPGPNPGTCWGGLVGGPAENITWVDDRWDYVHNEVAIICAFTNNLAAMMSLN